MLDDRLIDVRLLDIRWGFVLLILNLFEPLKSGSRTLTSNI
ncbi:hypothetical protein SAMN05444380_10233 [Thermophagus xiamenensis]|uniref:Uncharacterized protein n=1 Tax=Thermophagus xiamenensis TaxID=385682 RepID=A0A1I1V547_9BACT|nr:hypothetical protein SAMN05444380_10233 [Thermophagus xiamenensis]